jgi:hypothetical protein
MHEIEAGEETEWHVMKGPQVDMHAVRCVVSCSGAAVEWLQPESDEGSVEYKLRLKDPNPVRFQQLVCSATSCSCDVVWQHVPCAQ